MKLRLIGIENFRTYFKLFNVEKDNFNAFIGQAMVEITDLINDQYPDQTKKII